MIIQFDLFIILSWAIAGILLAMLFVMSFYYLWFWSASGKPVKPVPHSDKKSKFAILIAARGESKVIRNIFNSLRDQTYDKKFFDVWAIIEDINDPTAQIATEYGFHYFVRDELTDTRHTKGFALQECIRHFKKVGLKYDAYMIFDADNVMDSNYIEVMNDLRQTGVQVGLGYRNFTNANVNWLTVNSAVMFAYMNQLTARGRSIIFHKTTLMGTGYYVDADIIEEAGGWIFTGMTEDIQLTTYCYYHDIYMRYYPLIQFYDEQSAVFKTVHTQHIRWLAGYFEKRKFLKVGGINRSYHAKEFNKLMLFEFNYGLIPFIIFNVVTALYFVICVVMGILAIFYGTPYHYGMIFGLAGYQLFMLFIIFFIPAFIVIYRDNVNLKLTFKSRLKAYFLYGVFFYDFGLAFLDSFFHPKKKTWTKIEHTGEITSDDAKKVS